MRGNSTLVFLSLFFFSPISAKADWILYDDFEGEGPFNTTQNNYNSFTNWDVFDGTVDIAPKLPAPNSRRIASGMDTFGNIVDLDGSSSNAGTLRSKIAFSLTPGDYLLTWDMAGANYEFAGAQDTVVVSVGGLFSESFTLNNSDMVQTFVRQINVASNTSANLSFAHTGGDNYGILLDNVRFAAVPEPSSLAISPFILSLALFSRRKRRYFLPRNCFGC